MEFSVYNPALQRGSFDPARIAYEELFEGILLQDSAVLAAARSWLQETDMPMAAQIGEIEQRYETSIMDAPSINCEVHLDLMTSLGLQSYVYSGIYVNTTLVSLVAQLRGKNATWLQEQISLPLEEIQGMFPCLSQEACEQKRRNGVRILELIRGNF